MKRSLMLLLFILSAGAAFAVEPVNKTLFGGLALKGYDPVAYFKNGKPVKGDKRFEVEYKGATWRFASAESKREFLAAPEKYAPQYGGYCAYAVSRNYTADGDPEAWRIVNGKLYLNYNSKAQAAWEKDQEANIVKGDANWPGLLQK